MATSTNEQINKPSSIIKFNKSNHAIERATLLLRKRNGDIIGKIPYDNFKFSFVGSGLDELSFDIHKEKNGETYKFWDKLTGLAIVDYVGYGLFEANFTTNDADETIKTCNAVSLETELGQHTLHEEAHYNDEQAITNALPIDVVNGVYVPVVFCDKDNQNHSLLHRVIKDKAPHWSIGRVPALLNVNGMVYESNTYQRTFDGEGSTIYDFLMDIATECNVLFTFDTYNRVINCWNLEECVFEWSTCAVIEGAYYQDGIMYDKDDIAFEVQENYGFCDGIGYDTNIIVSKKQLAQDFSIQSDKDSVKNCFYVTGGDDIVNNTIPSVSVTGNNYIYMFDQFQYDDMPSELTNKIKEYSALLDESKESFYKIGGVYVYDKDCTYDEITQTCRNSNLKILTDAIYQDGKVYVYDSLAYYQNDKAYNKDGNELSEGDYIYTNDAGLFVEYLQLQDRYYYLNDSKFPNVEYSDTTATDEGEKLVKSLLSQNIIIQNTCSSDAYSHVTSTVETYINTIIDSRYTAKVINGDDYSTSCTDINSDNPTGVWTGYVKLTRDTDDSDEDIVSVAAIINYVSYEDIDTSKEYLLQKFNIALAKMDIANLDLSSYTDNDSLSEYFRQYNLTSLKSYLSCFKSCISTLDELYPNSDTVSVDLSDSYNTIRSQYNNYISVVEVVISELEPVVKWISSVMEIKLNEIAEFRKTLDMQTYMGEDLYKLLRSYIREGEYQNDNYISDGLTDAQLIENCKELLDVATAELEKACVLQQTVAANINNIFAIPLYENLFDQFAMFNYIRARIDGKLYKLRIVQIDYDENELQSLNVTFSDVVTYTDGTISDLQSMKDSFQSISSSYTSTILQAKQGATAMNNFTVLKQEGLISADYVIKNSDSEEVIIDNNGINLRSQNDIGCYGDHQCRLIGNGLYLTDDAWKSPPRAAIGLMKLNGEWIYGVIADAICGDLLVGKQLQITNDTNTVIIDGEGITITNGLIQSSNYTDDEGNITGEGSMINLTDGSFSFAGGNLTYNSENGLKVVGNIEAFDGTFHGTFNADNFYLNTKEETEYNNVRSYIQFNSPTQVQTDDMEHPEWYEISEHLKLDYNGVLCKRYESGSMFESYMHGYGTNYYMAYPYQEDTLTWEFTLNIGSGYNGIYYYETNSALNDNTSNQFTLDINGIYSQNRIAIGTIYTDLDYSQYGLSVSNSVYVGGNITTGGSITASSAVITGDITIGGNGVVKKLNDGGHLLSMGWNGYNIQMCVDTTYFHMVTKDSWTSYGNLDLGVQGYTAEGSAIAYPNLASVSWVEGKLDSDERVKHNFSSLPSCIDNIFDSLSPQQYEFNNILEKEGIHFGDTAQHIEKIFEENGLNIEDYSIVRQRDVNKYNGESEHIKDDKYHYINENDVIWLCVDQIQKLKQRIKELERN